MNDFINSISLKDSDNFEDTILKIKLVDECSGKLSDISRDLIVRRDELWFKLITEKQILSNTDWFLLSAIGQVPTLNYSGDDSLTSKLLFGQKFIPFLSIKLEDKIEFEFQKGKSNISIYFYDKDCFMAFVKSNNMNIVGNTVFNQIRNLRIEIHKYEKICHELGLKE